MLKLLICYFFADLEVPPEDGRVSDFILATVICHD